MSQEDGYEGVTVAGIAVIRRDGGTTALLARRAADETDAPDVAETWEFPGGHLMEGEEPFAAASREFEEEIGAPLPAGEVVGGWRSEDGHYQGFVYEAATFDALENLPLSAEVQAVAWYSQDELLELGDSVRPEVRGMDLSAVFLETEDLDDADEPAEAEEDVPESPELDLVSLSATPIKVHGALAPEGVASGDSRGFVEGAVTRRAPLRLPFMWQKAQQPGHDGAVTIGSMDRLMRRDGMIHWEGELLPDSRDAEDFIALLAHFGRYGVSVDGDKGSIDEVQSEADGMAWFDAIRAAGLTACAIPAFEEAFVALGPHPDMPDEGNGDVLVAGARPETLFKRGPGWVTDPVPTKRIHSYWTKPGQEGFIKIGWGQPGDFTRCTALVGEKIAENSPDKLRFLKRICAEWHHDALGYWPGELDMPGNKTSEEAEAERQSASDVGIEIDATGKGWETVLVSSGQGAQPALSYFHRPEPDTAVVIEPADANGFRHTYGYAAKWGVCHVGMGGRCVEPPRTFSDDYPEFHLGRTRTDEGYINTGVLTYGVGHRDAETILSESPEQAFFDNINNAWAAVRIGEDDMGIWFSGVVLPGVPEDHIVKIEASGQVSGEWKMGALRAVLTVNVPGFPVERPSAVYDNDGNVMALAASAFGQVADAPCEPTPAERMQALALVDAEVRFAAMRKEWGA